MAAFPNLVLTNAGIALQNKVQGGATLELTNIQMGSGQLNGQPIGPLTALISSNATVPIQGGQAIGQNTYQVEGFFTNADLSAGFWWREIGIFANDPDKGEILYAYANAGDAGDYIPTVTDQRIEKYIYFSMALANATTVNVTIPQTDTFVLKTEVGQPNGVAGLDENGAVPIPQGGTGETTAQAALAALGAGVRPNLLDNAIFVGGGTGYGVLPINQRGKTSYSFQDGTNIFDRWKIVDDHASVELAKDGIIIRDGKTSGDAVIAFTQTLPRVLNDDVFTMSCVVAEIVGTWVFSCNSFKDANILATVGINEAIIPRENASFSNKDFYFYKISSGADDYIKVMAVKIERGEGQTLAYQDDEGFIHLLPQPDSNYASQLLRCQQYFQLYSSPEMRPEKAIDCRPVMRIDPTPGTLQIDEQTYYYNSAEL